MSTSSDPQSSSESESFWWTPSSWVPDATQDSPSALSTLHSDWSSEVDSLTLSSSWTWSETYLPTAARMTDAGPPSTSTLTPSAPSSSLTEKSSSISPSLLIVTQTSQTGSTGQNTKGTAVKLRTSHIVAVSIVTFVVLLAMAGLFIYLIRFRIRKLGHQRLYSAPDENFDDDSTVAFLENAGRNSGGEAFSDSAAVGMRSTGSTREPIPSRLGWYHSEWRSHPCGEASLISRPSLSQSNSPSSQEREKSSLGLNNVHDSPTVQSRSSVLFVEETYGPLSPLDPPRYSQILPMKPNARPPRPLPVPSNPRPLMPQRRIDSIQVRKQNKPPLISSSTTSFPSLFSPSTSSSAPSSTCLRTTGQGLGAVQEFPLQPQLRRTDSTVSRVPENSPLTPLRPAVSLEHTPQINHRTNVSTA